MSPLIPHEGSIGYVIKVSNMKNFLCGLLLDLFIFLVRKCMVSNMKDLLDLLVSKCMVLKIRPERGPKKGVVSVLMVGPVVEPVMT